jgi:glutathione synthase/RimK-type ligase-like ATP-grasp enzyme
VNPLASASRAGKAVQAKLALSIGLLTPETYIGADPDIAHSFTDKLFRQDKLACTKPIHSKKFQIGDEERTRYTELLVPTNRDSLKSLEPCPIIFQEYIPKAYEIRATVIGDRVFAARIDSQSAGGGTAVDWRRYNIPKTPHHTYTLPSTLENQIITLQQRLGLMYSAFDFICTPSGEYVFLETNPFGQWLWIEDLAGLPISKAIAEFLATPSA